MNGDTAQALLDDFVVQHTSIDFYFALISFKRFSAKHDSRNGAEDGAADRVGDADVHAGELEMENTFVFVDVLDFGSHSSCHCCSTVVGLG